jgi:hypothetical protein
MNDFLFGAIAMASAVAGLVFLRYFVRTRDSFFFMFAIAFWLESLGSALSVTSEDFGDQTTARFVLRIVQYLLIIAAIAHKNVPRR